MTAQRDIHRADLPSGITLPYVTAGSSAGTPVLLLHPWGESRRSFDLMLPLLPPSLRAIAMDQRGHGEATKPHNGYTLEALARDVVELMQGIGLPSAVLLGSSSGGYVAQQIAVSYPEVVSGLVLVGAPRSLQGRPAFADEVDQLTDPIDADWVRESLTWFPTFHEIPQWYIDDRVADGLAMPAHVWREALHGLMTSSAPTDTATITAPTLIIWGDRDELLPRDQAEALHAAIPGSRLVVYENTGHVVLWEQPARVASDLAEFVAGLWPWA